MNPGMRTWIFWFLLALVLVVPSAGIVNKMAGFSGLLLYILLVFLAVMVLERGKKPIAIWCQSASDLQSTLFLVFSFFVLAMLMLTVFPMVDVQMPGRGSDGDDALDAAATELLNGRYPYYPRTYLDNPISPLPGSVLLAIPFVLLATSAWQNLFWLLLFTLTMARVLRSLMLAVLMLWAVLLISPAVIYKFAVGTDYISNCLFVLLAALWLRAEAGRQADPSRWRILLAAAVLGVALSSRLNFIMVMPIVAATIMRQSGVWMSVQSLCVAGASFFLLTMPFYLYDPAGFSPLHTFNKVDHFRNLLPYSGLLVAAVTGLVALLCAWRMGSGIQPFIAGLAWVMGVPVFLTIGLGCLQSGAMDLSNTLYGVFYVIFAIAAWWLKLFLPEFPDTGSTTDQGESAT